MLLALSLACWKLRMDHDDAAEGGVGKVRKGPMRERQQADEFWG